MRHSGQLRLLALLAAAIGLVSAMAISMRSGDEMRVAGRLGPTPGPNSAGHVEAKRDYLKRIAAEEPDRAAAGLISASHLLSVSQAKTLTDGMQVTVVFVRFPGGQPDVLAVTDSLEQTLAAGTREFGDVIRREVASLEQQVGSAQGAERATLEDSLNKRKQTLSQLTTDCACVYAIAVQGTTLGALARVQGSGEVLLVDVPEPVTDDLKGWELTPILPATSS
jgi:hypothetical protein